MLIVLDLCTYLLQDLTHVCKVPGYLDTPAIPNNPEIEAVVKPLQADREPAVPEAY